MPAPGSRAEALWSLVRESFDSFVAECEAHGIVSERRPELRRGRGLFCSYDLRERVIYIAIADPDDAMDRLQLLLIGSLVGCKDEEALIDFQRLLLRRAVAHELGHFYRDQYGLMGADLWHEEHVANHLANALTNHRMPAEERESTERFLRSSLDCLARKLGVKDLAADSYCNPVEALGVLGQIGSGTIQSLYALKDLLSIGPEELLLSSGLLSPEERGRIERRDELVGVFNQQYAGDLVTYLYYALGWWYIALASRERHYVDEFAAVHLNQSAALLPDIPERSGANGVRAVRACYHASRAVASCSETASRYFYKRYRALLLDTLQEATTADPALVALLQGEVSALLENWDDREADALGFLCRIASPALLELFPHRIGATPAADPLETADFPAETDRRLWAFITAGAEDRAAAQTLERLAALEQCPIFRPLPAEVLLDLAHQLYQVRLSTGEALIWEGELNSDVYVVVRGRLEVLVKRGAEAERVGTVGAGEILGEMAYFTREPRSATVRATEAAECYVLKATSLRLAAMKQPMMVHEMAGVLARRLSRR